MDTIFKLQTQIYNKINIKQWCPSFVPKSKKLSFELIKNFNHKAYNNIAQSFPSTLCSYLINWSICYFKCRNKKLIFPTKRIIVCSLAKMLPVSNNQTIQSCFIRLFIKKLYLGNTIPMNSTEPNVMKLFPSIILKWLL